MDLNLPVQKIIYFHLTYTLISINNVDVDGTRLTSNGHSGTRRFQMKNENVFKHNQYMVFTFILALAV